MKHCHNCNGAVLEPNKAYLYSGPVCNCSSPNFNPPQFGAMQYYGTNQTDVITEILETLKRIESKLK